MKLSQRWAWPRIEEVLRTDSVQLNLLLLVNILGHRLALILAPVAYKAFCQSCIIASSVWGREDKIWKEWVELSLYMEVGTNVASYYDLK